MIHTVHDMILIITIHRLSFAKLKASGDREDR